MAALAKALAVFEINPAKWPALAADRVTLQLGAPPLEFRAAANASRPSARV